MNNKDFSYENFMLKKRRESLEDVGKKWHKM
jgi:hypothetical protein